MVKERDNWMYPYSERNICMSQLLNENESHFIFVISIHNKVLQITSYIYL